MRVIDGQATKTYRVRWEIDIDAGTPRQAAQRAQVIMQDRNDENLATVFQVYERMEPVKMEEIDLGEPTDDPTPKLSVETQEGYVCMNKYADYVHGLEDGKCLVLIEMQDAEPSFSRLLLAFNNLIQETIDLGQREERAGL